MRPGEEEEENKGKFVETEYFHFPRLPYHILDTQVEDPMTTHAYFFYIIS